MPMGLGIAAGWKFNSVEHIYDGVNSYRIIRIYIYVDTTNRQTDHHHPQAHPGTKIVPYETGKTFELVGRN
jgi:hypothetical protein